MSPSSKVPYVELRVAMAESEEKFLLLAVQAALTQYRASQHKESSEPHTRCHDVIALRHSVG